MRSTTESGRRADARRNLAAIVEAGLLRLADDPDASVADIARTAGLGRVTVYGHFATRADLVEAVLAHALADAEQTSGDLAVTGDAERALTEFIGSSWRTVVRLRNVLVAAERELPPERIRPHSDRTAQRVRAIIEKGRHDGTFRADLPIDWMVAVVHSTLHAAAEETAAGRMAEAEADAAILATLLAAFRARADRPRP